MISSNANFPSVTTDRAVDTSTNPPAFRLVHGQEDRQVAVLDDFGSDADAVDVATPNQVETKLLPVSVLQIPTPAHPIQVSDIERLVGELDVEKVLMVPIGVTINGDIDTNGLASLVISGTVNGSIKAGAGTVIVCESGVVIGTIYSDLSIAVAGKVTCDDGVAIVTSGLWILSETAVVRGDVAYARQRAYEGGVFSGRAIPFSEYKA